MQFFEAPYEKRGGMQHMPIGPPTEKEELHTLLQALS